MPIQLTPLQQHSLDVAQETPARAIDPRTNVAYVLVPEEDYEVVRELLQEEQRQRAIHEIGLRNAVGRMDESP